MALGPVVSCFTISCLLCWVLLFGAVKSDGCSSNPCMFNGTCTNTTDDSYMCECPPERTGTNCASYVDLCLSNPCSTGATCTSITGMTYTCMCTSEQTGTHCENDVDLCSSNPCQNGATCTSNDGMTYTCMCPSGRTGTHCESYVDLCLSNPCQNGATCTSNDGMTYTCMCPSGRTGTHCESFIDKCMPNPCNMNVKCTSMQGTNFQCDCPAERTGTTCESFVDLCLSTPCSSDGTCMSFNGMSFNCTCLPGRAGELCEIITNKMQIKVKLDMMWKEEYATDPAAREALAVNLTSTLKQGVCPNSSCDLMLVGASPGSVNLHYSATAGTRDDIVLAQDRLVNIQNSLTDVGVLGMPVVVVNVSEKVNVDNIQPKFGPQLGDTKVTITGFDLDLGPNMFIKFGNNNCMIKTRSSTYLACTSEMLSMNSLLGKPLAVSIGINGETPYLPSATFTYRPNPSLTAITPLSAIVRGGILLTVEGTGLDSVPAVTSLVINANTSGTITSYSEDCRPLSSTRIVCPTPTVNTTDNPLPDSSFMVAIRFGEIPNFENFATIKLYSDPTIFKFRDSNRHKNTILLRTYSPHNDKYITIQGSGLLRGLRMTDYNVSAGSKSCDIDTIMNDRIICAPPTDKSRQLQVTVSIGVNRPPYPIGTVVINNSVLDNKGTVIGIVVGCLLFVLIAGSAVGFCGYTHYKQKQREEDLKVPRKYVRGPLSQYDKERKGSNFAKRVSHRIRKGIWKAGYSMSSQPSMDTDAGYGSSMTSKSTVSEMPMAGRINHNYENPSDPYAGETNIFLRHFSKFVSRHRNGNSEMDDDPVYNELQDFRQSMFNADGIRFSGLNLDGGRMITDPKLPEVVENKEEDDGSGEKKRESNVRFSEVDAAGMWMPDKEPIYEMKLPRPDVELYSREGINPGEVFQPTDLGEGIRRGSEAC